MKAWVAGARRSISWETLA